MPPPSSSRLSLFAFIEPCRPRFRRTAVRRKVPTVGGVVGSPEQLPLSERRIDFRGCGGPEPVAVVDVDSRTGRARRRWRPAIAAQA